MLLLLALPLWILPLILMKAATRCRAGRVVALAVYLPVHWLLALILGWGGAMLVFVLLHEFVPGFR